MSELNDEAFASIMTHMNEDHAEAVVAYAKYFGKQGDVAGARMVECDARGMTLEIVSGESRSKLHIPFDHELVDRKDARATLVAMAELALAAPGPRPST